MSWDSSNAPAVLEPGTEPDEKIERPWGDVPDATAADDDFEDFDEDDFDDDFDDDFEEEFEDEYDVETEEFPGDHLDDGSFSGDEFKDDDEEKPSSGDKAEDEEKDE